VNPKGLEPLGDPDRTRADRVGSGRRHDLEVGLRMGPFSERLPAASGDLDDGPSSLLTTGIEKGTRTFRLLCLNFSATRGVHRALKGKPGEFAPYPGVSYQVKVEA